MKKKLLIVYCLILFLVGGCGNNGSNIEKYKYAILLSEQQQDAKLQYYDESGKLLGSKKIKKARGVDKNGSASRNNTLFINGDWYLGVCPDEYFLNYTLKINSDTLGTDYIPTNAGEDYMYTEFFVDEKFVYAAYNTQNAYIIKSDLDNHEVLAEREIKNIAIEQIYPYDDKLIITCHTDELMDGMTIAILDGTTLDTEKEIKIKTASLSSDGIIYNDKLYIMPKIDTYEKDIKQLLSIDLLTEEIKTIALPFTNAEFLRIVDNKIYIVNELKDEESSSLAILDLETHELLNTMDFDFTTRDIALDGNKMILVSNEMVYIYDINENYKQIHSFEIQDIGEYMFGSFLVKPSEKITD